MYKGTDKVLELLTKKKMGLEELARASSLNEDSIRRIIESLRADGYVEIESHESISPAITPELAKYGQDGFPELAVFKKALSGATLAELSPIEKSIGIRWAKVKGLVRIEGGRLVPEKTVEDADQVAKELYDTYYSIKTKGDCGNDEIKEEFYERHLLNKKTTRTSTVAYTGKAIDWSKFTDTFDVNIPSPNARFGKNHPITRMTMKIKSIMSELGFEEMDGSIIESSFWNFDALFQPQDHPARELADTFYLKADSPLPEDKALVQRVRAAHESGWKYQWDPKEASRAVLRTHTTCLSARYLAALGYMKNKKPKKYFAIGRVFRNEATDYKHLAEFHQVEGIISWEGATFTDLLGVLKEFYRKLGFEKIRFRPSFFPYTEPSLEIEVYFEKKKQWLELGGGGIFRPEVSIPLAGTYPVLAWGLSLERPLMLLLELEDIRDLYRNDVDFLTSVRLDL